jgi:hypothetical protein
MSDVVREHDDDAARLIRARAVIKEVVEATMAPRECRPRGAFKARDKSVCRALIDTLGLLDLLCVAKGAEPVRLNDGGHFTRGPLLH